MRGKVHCFGNVKDQVGITPAYAGKSFTDSICAIQNEDHPRLCGEKLWIIKMKFLPLGSPPPMRGKAVNAHVTFLHVGITPAYAGKSQRLPPAEYPDQDHPRLCGEKLETRHDFTEKLGSPPPMRGKVL